MKVLFLVLLTVITWPAIGFSCTDCDDCEQEMQDCATDPACGIDDMLIIVEDVLAEC